MRRKKSAASSSDQLMFDFLNPAEENSTGAQARDGTAFDQAFGLRDNADVLPPEVSRPTFHPLYFAVRPGSKARESIACVADNARGHLGSHGELLSDRWHITLLCVGFIRDDQALPELDMALKAAAAVHLPPISVTFDRISGFGKQSRPAVALRCCEGADDLRQLQQRLYAELKTAGWPNDIRNAFEPHMTLFYHHARIDDIHLDEPIILALDEFVLFRSLSGEGRHVVEPHWRWALNGEVEQPPTDIATRPARKPASRSMRRP